jgi:hypothetical protein
MKTSSSIIKTLFPLKLTGLGADHFDLAMDQSRIPLLGS